MNRFLSAATLALFACLLSAPRAWADICMYRNAAGEVTYSNVTEAPPRDSRKIRCFKQKREPAAAPSQPQAADTGSDFPSVDDETQSERDDSRLTILQEELNAEQKRLDAALQQLEAQESVRLGSESNYQRYIDRVQPYRDAVENHERNIKAIESEIKNLR